MGTGIAEVLARAGTRGHRCRGRRGVAGRGRPRGVHRPGRAARSDHRTRAAGGARPVPGLRRSVRRGRRGPGDRGRARGLRHQARGVHSAGRRRAPRHDPGHRHQRAVGDPARGRLGPPRTHSRPALLQPRTGYEAGRGSLLGTHLAGDRRLGHRARPRTRQGARLGRRPARIRRRRAAIRLPQPGSGDVRVESTRPARTSTRRCGWAAGCRWARWRCST